MKATVKKVVGSLMILSLSLVGTACTNDASIASTPGGSEMQAAAVIVHAESIRLGTVGTISELSGTLTPIEEATVSFEVAGEIKALPFKEGDAVQQGDILARLAATDYSLQLALANADVSGASAQLAKVKNGARDQEVQQAKVAVDAKKITLEQAQNDYRRMEQLHKSGAISQHEFENAQHAYQLAGKDFAEAEATYSLVVAGARVEDVSATQASYQGAVVTRAQAAATLAKTEVKAPIEGTVLAKMADVGQLASPGAPVYRIGNVRELKTILPVPDKEISAWKVGDEVELTLYENNRKAKVTKIYPATNEQTGTIGVEVVVDNANQDWFAGQVVSAKRTLFQKEGIFVPAEAVFRRGSEPYVFLLRDGKAAKTPVMIGQYADNAFEITKGVSVGDVLLTKGADRLLGGEPVTVKGGSQHD